MEEFFDWCCKHKAMTLPNSKLGKAFAYSLNHETTFKHVLLDGRLILSNNLAERAIKTLVIGARTGYSLRVLTEPNLLSFLVLLKLQNAMI